MLLNIFLSNSGTCTGPVRVPHRNHPGRLVWSTRATRLLCPFRSPWLRTFSAINQGYPQGESACRGHASAGKHLVCEFSLCYILSTCAQKPIVTAWHPDIPTSSHVVLDAALQRFPKASSVLNSGRLLSAGAASARRLQQLQWSTPWDVFVYEQQLDNATWTQDVWNVLVDISGLGNGRNGRVIQ